MNDYILEISFDAADGALEELVQARLFLTASTGSTSVEGAGTATVSAYFDSPAERDAAAGELAGVAGIALQATERERLDWLSLYQQSLAPLFIGGRFVVAPDAALIPAESERLRIVVPQEQAFGTGSHETTSLCIELLESMELFGRRGLDVGAGSGILAIAMYRLGARKVMAFDNDPDAYAALRENRTRNAVPEAAMPLFIGSTEALRGRSTEALRGGSTEALRGGLFDVVTMNIIPEVIIPILGDVVSRMAADASLLVSGVLVTRRDEVVAAGRAHGLAPVAEATKGEWWAGVLQRG